MRTIIIEPAPNGWIVSEKHNAMGCLFPVLGVYTTIEALQAELPSLLDIDVSLNALFLARPSAFKHTPPHFPYLSNEEKQALLKPSPGDRTPETIGGNELTPSS